MGDGVWDPAFDYKCPSGYTWLTKEEYEKKKSASTTCSSSTKTYQSQCGWRDFDFDGYSTRYDFRFKDTSMETHAWTVHAGWEDTQKVIDLKELINFAGIVCGEGPAVQPVQTNCDWVIQNRNTNGEKNIGEASSPEECITMVKAQCSGATIANLPKEGHGSCWCQFGNNMEPDPSSSWQTCLLSSITSNAAGPNPPLLEDSCGGFRESTCGGIYFAAMGDGVWDPAFDYKCPSGYTWLTKEEYEKKKSASTTCSSSTKTYQSQCGWRDFDFDGYSTRYDFRFKDTSMETHAWTVHAGWEDTQKVIDLKELINFAGIVCGEGPAVQPVQTNSRGHYWAVIGEKAYLNHRDPSKPLNPECLPKSAKHSENTHNFGNNIAVACCKDGGSKGSRPGCVSGVTFDEAKAQCQAGGLRLCTRNEIEEGKTGGTGCMFDYYLHWTSTPCDVAQNAELKSKIEKAAATFQALGNTHNYVITMLAMIGALTMMYQGVKGVHKMVFATGEFQKINEDEMEC